MEGMAVEGKLLEIQSAAFAEIGNAVAGELPKGWTKVWLQVEMAPTSGSVEAFYLAPDTPKPAYFDLSFNMYRLFAKLYAATRNADPSGAWSTMTYILEPEGNLHVDYGHEPVSPAGRLERRLAWKARYLPS